MPRRKAAVKREILADPIYKDKEVAKFINVLMRDGKKTVAERIMYSALQILLKRLKKEGRENDRSGTEESSGQQSSGGQDISKHTSYDVKKAQAAVGMLRKSLANVSPTVEVKSRRVGGATYQVPVEIVAARATALAMRWVMQAARSRAEKTMALRLAGELYDAYMGRGAAIKMRDDVHRMAKANQAFAGYRW